MSPGHGLTHRSASAGEGEAAPGRSSTVAAGLEWAAFALILAVLVARPFTSEMPFRAARPLPDPSTPLEVLPLPDELVRLTLSMLLVVAFVLWSLAAAVRGSLRRRGVWFGALALGFIVLSAASIPRALDARGAADGWLDQAAMLLAAFVMMQLARSARRWGMVAVVLAALAGVMGVKAILQSLYETPLRAAEYQADPDRQLAIVGLQPDTPEARMFQRRLADRSATGFLFLSNPFASLMLVLTLSAGGVTLEKALAARRERRSGRAPAPGEVHLPTLAAMLTGAAAILSAAGLALTFSKGGIGAGLLSAAGACVLVWKRDFFARRWRAALAACAIALLAGGAVVVVLGLARGQLPGRSLQVRWEYWVGTARIIRQDPLLGVGAENFTHAYAAHRLPEAGEAVKSAHNAPLDMAAQFGLPAGLLYVAMLAYLVVAMCRPRTSPPAPAGPRRRSELGSAFGWLVLLTGAVLLIRMAALGTNNGSLLLLEAVLPAAAMGVFLLAGQWTGDSLAADRRCGWGVRLAVACGLVGLLLHSLVEFSLSMPATATLFWASAGALAGADAPDEPRPLPWSGRTLLAVLPLAAVLAATVWLVQPVAARTLAARRAEAACAAGNLTAAGDDLQRAVQADPLDAAAPTDLARLYRNEAMSAWVNALGAGAPDPTSALRPPAQQAVNMADLAWRRSPTADHALLTAALLWLRDEPSATALAWAARAGDLKAMIGSVESDIARKGPTVPLLNALAGLQCQAGEPAMAYQTLLRAATIAGDGAPAVYDHLGDLAWRLDRGDDAAAQWRKYARLSAQAMSESPAIGYAELAVRADPMALSMGMIHARLLYAAGRYDAAEGEIRRLRRINDARPVPSDLRFTDAELEELKLLEIKIGQVRSGSATARKEQSR